MTFSPATYSPNRGADGDATREKRPAATPRTRRVGRALRLALPGLLLLFVVGTSGNQEPVPEVEQTTVINLQNRPAEKVMAALQPHLVGRPVSVSVTGSQIFLHGPTRDLGMVIDLITAIDTPIRMLWVTLRQDQDDPTAGREPRSGAIRGGNRSSSDTFPEGDPVLIGYEVTNQWGTRKEDVASVLVREGDWASVEVRSIPMGSGFGAQTQVTPRIEVYAPELTTISPARDGGFLVRPQVARDRVTLEIDFYRSIDDPWSGNPRMLAQRTVLTGRVGDWMPLGGQPDSAFADTTGGVVARTRSSNISRLQVRVTPALNQ